MMSVIANFQNDISSLLLTVAEYFSQYFKKIWAKSRSNQNVPGTGSQSSGPPYYPFLFSLLTAEIIPKSMIVFSTVIKLRYKFKNRSILTVIASKTTQLNNQYSFWPMDFAVMDGIANIGCLGRSTSGQDCSKMNPWMLEQTMVHFRDCCGSLSVYK